MRIETDKIYCGDSLQVLQTLPENAVDCCVTSPPYYALRDYGADGKRRTRQTCYLKSRTKPKLLDRMLIIEYGIERHVDLLLRGIRI